jgi:sec-independent protein translocase protein TatA
MLLFLNDIAASEVMVIFLFILLFFGSKSIPGIARTMGKTIRQIKEASDDVKTEIRKSGMDMKKDMNLKSLVSDTARDLTRPLDQMTEDMDQAMNGRGVNGHSKPVPVVPPFMEEEALEIEETPESLEKEQGTQEKTIDVETKPVTTPAKEKKNEI